jgi:hypothetical protein
METKEKFIIKPKNQKTIENKEIILDKIVKKLIKLHNETDSKLKELSEMCMEKDNETS